MKEKSRRLEIIDEMLKITDNMLLNRGDAEVLIVGVEDRQTLIEEYDIIAASEGPLSAQEQSEANHIAKLILEKDTAVTDALKQLQSETREELAENTRQQKSMALQYAHNSVVKPGSFLNSKL